VTAEGGVFESAGHDVYELRVPASSDRLSIARLFAAAMIRHDGAGEDVVEDLRLAVSEACTIALQSVGSASALVLSLGPVPEGLAIDVRTTPADDPVPDHLSMPDPAESWGAELLEAVVTDLELTSEGDERIGVSFVLPFARTSGRDPDHDADPDTVPADDLDRS